MYFFHSDYDYGQADECRQALSSWAKLISWLREAEDTHKVWMVLSWEVQNKARPKFIDRCRTRYNSLRAKQELRMIEDAIGKRISTNDD